MSGPVRIGLVGLGTIGTGVARLLLEQVDTSAFRSKEQIVLQRIADKDLSDRGVAIPAGMLTDNVQDVLAGPDIDIVIELIGGIEPARQFVLTAIGNGKHVVTANKALIAHCGDEIFQAACERGVDVLFEAAVGGSIPILRALRESIQTSRIQSMFGIVNGTCNYILTRMADEGTSYDDMLRSAQAEGFAEPDPTADVTGQDSAQKLAILLRLGFKAVVSPTDLLWEGIERITPLDIAYAHELGYTIKLLAIAKRHGSRVEARVHPAMIPTGNVMADVKFEYNAIEVVGDEFGTQVFYGKGAGQRPTATVVVSDVLDIAARMAGGICVCRVGDLLANGQPPALIPPEEITMRHYVRLDVADRPGVLREIAHVFASNDISIESVIQKGRKHETSDTVPLIIMTHEATEGALASATESLEQLSVVRAPIQRIRVEDL